MKSLHVAILVAVSAVAGAFVMKWQIGRNHIPVRVAAAEPARPAPQVVPVHSQPAEAALPSPFVDEKTPKEIETPLPPRKVYRAKPVVIARNMTQSRSVPQTSPQAQIITKNNEPAPAPPIAVAPAPLAQQPAAPAPAQPEPIQPEPTPPERTEVVAPPQPPSPPPPQPAQVVLKAGTVIAVRIGERLSSDRSRAGDGFTATLDQPLAVDGWVIAERGAHLEGKVVQPQRTTSGTGSSDLAIVLTQLSTSDGQRVPIETETLERHGQSATAGESAGKVAVGAVIGAAIGAIAGGGKGAGIGAGVGGAAGGGAAIATRGKGVVLPAETRITFRLRNSITLTERRNNKS
jgi:hypothetical protein